MKMRVALFTLALVNLAFLAWARWIDAAPRAAAGQPDSKSPRLMLASETEAKASVGPSPIPVANTIAATPVRCVSVGPFNTLERSTAAASVLQQRGLEPRQRSEQGETWDGYWVYVGGLKSVTEEARVIYLLDQAGLPDARVMPRSEAGRRVSVGLFSDRKRAERRARVVRRLNLDAQVGERRVPGTIYWLDLDLGTSDGELTTVGLVSPEESGVPVEIRACPALQSPS